MIQDSQPTAEQPWNRRWAIILRSRSDMVGSESGGEKMIGVIGTPRKADIGYKLHPDYWGKGYMSEALKLFLEMWWGMEGMFTIFSCL